MTKPIKWLLAIVATFLTLALVLYIAMRVFVGAVDLDAVLNNPAEFNPANVGSQIQVPDGFSIGTFAADLTGARVLRFSDEGDLLVSMPKLGQIIILKDDDSDGRADRREVLLQGLNGPNGIDFFEGWLYVAESDALGRVSFDHATGLTTSPYQQIVTGLPGGGNHWKKTLRFGPDNLMYVSMGSSCNVCTEDDERRGTLVRYSPDGTNEMIFARGLRNSAGFDWSANGDIYATDNGRDLLGDDYPPCELNLVTEGAHYGWPYANGNQEPDPDFGAGNEALIEKSVAPVHNFKAHNAPLGIEFIDAEGMPEEYQGAAIVALHGSWNRSEKDGYKVVSLHWNAAGEISERDFVSGFLDDGDVLGRPAEVVQGPDGAVYISDDYSGVIYRVAYGEQQQLQLGSVADAYNAENSLSSYTNDDVDRLNTAGKALYNQYQCIACHNDNGRGLKTLENLGLKYDVETLSEYLRRPNAPMPQFPFDEAQREALSVYLIDRYRGS